jgi:hypothetical protein
MSRGVVIPETYWTPEISKRGKISSVRTKIVSVLVLAFRFPIQVRERSCDPSSLGMLIIEARKNISEYDLSITGSGPLSKFSTRVFIRDGKQKSTLAANSANGSSYFTLMI